MSEATDVNKATIAECRARLASDRMIYQQAWNRIQKVEHEMQAAHDYMLKCRKNLEATEREYNQMCAASLKQ